MADEPTRVVSLLSDFGQREHYVASMKAAILMEAPTALLLDMSHNIAAHNVFEAAFTLYLGQKDMPLRAINVAVVDPGVGTERRRLVVVTEDHLFVGPDNGIFSFIYANCYISKVLEINADHYFNKSMGRTFEGRDVFAPIAAQLAKGVEVEKMGEPITNYLRFKLPELNRLSDSTVKGEVCHIDHFGNMVTNIEADVVNDMFAKSGKEKAQILFGAKEIPFSRDGTYESEQAGVFGLLNSAGMVEIAGYKTSAAKALGQTRRGEKVGLVLS